MYVHYLRPVTGEQEGDREWQKGFGTIFPGESRGSGPLFQFHLHGGAGEEEQKGKRRKNGNFSLMRHSSEE